MDDLSAILASIFSSGTFNEMLRRATPVALAAIGGRGGGAGESCGRQEKSGTHRALRICVWGGDAAVRVGG